jgi:hypothetical protein
MRFEPFYCLFAIALSQCGGVGDEPTTGRAREAIVGGAASDASDSPVVYLQSPEGACTAVLVAPRLAASARHCVARSTAGSFSCTASGDLILTGNGAGQIGSDDPPESISFFSSATIARGGLSSGSADAVGVRILSTQTSTSCRDDLAFVILDREIPGLLPAPIRVDEPTLVGEVVSVWGYGLTDQVEPLALRTRSDAQITGVGPDMPSTDTQNAPVRAVRTGPVTCQGDSGGPMLSADGALVAIVSLGNQAGASGPFCSNNGYSGTVGPRLAAYRNLVIAALAAAGAGPIADADVDAGSLIEASMPDATTDPDDAADSAEPAAPAFSSTGSCCTVAPGRRHSQPGGVAAVALALTAAAMGRRRG